MPAGGPVVARGCAAEHRGGGPRRGRWAARRFSRAGLRNLREQKAVEQAMQDPAAGRTLPNVEMNDPRWRSSEGWVKKQQTVQSGGDPINVHYNYNTVTGAVDDFKIVIRGQSGAAGGGG